MGIVSTAHSCRGSGGQLEYYDSHRPSPRHWFRGPPAGNLLGSFFKGDPFGMAASVPSLATNVVSTCLTGWQAWKHRTLVRNDGPRSYLGRSQVSRAFALLIESGAFYSVIWILVVAYQSIAGPVCTKKVGMPESSPFRAFTAGWEAFTEGALVTIIAIYPTVIMLVVALNGSECNIIASNRGDGQEQDAGLVFRGSILQPVDFVDVSRSVEGLASTSLSSFSDNRNYSQGPVDVPKPRLGSRIL